MNKKVSSIKRLLPYMKPYGLSYFWAILLTIVSDIASVLEPFIWGLALTEISRGSVAILQKVPGASLNYPYIGWILVIYFFRGLTYQVSSYLANVAITNAVQGTIRDLRQAMNQKLNRLPVSYVDQHQFGDLLGRMTGDVESVSNALQQSLLQIVNAVFTLGLVMAMMIWLNVSLALVIIISMPLSYWVAKKVLALSQPYFKGQADALGRLYGFVQENLTGFNVIKLYGREEQSAQEFYDITHNLQKVGFKATMMSSMVMPLVGLISHMTYLLLALLGGLAVLQGVLTIGNLQAFVQYVWQVNQPIQTITQLTGALQSAKSSLDRILELMDAPEEVVSAKAHLAGPLTGRVSFKDVAFHYQEDKPLIRNFNLEVEPGQMIAIVGPTGAGKTTLINLLMRFYDVTQGAIQVDGLDIRDLPRQELRRQFGMVLQDAWLYEGTIKDNLRFGNLDATDEQIVEAAKAANVDHFIRTLPGGYNMKMNQESSNISLGQKQLLTIARALLADPKILILDEATSSVDTRLELLIQKAMSRLMEGRTSFVIAHRLSTIQEADKILVLRDGQIVEQGNHDSLLAAKGFYYELYQSQFNQ